METQKMNKQMSDLLRKAFENNKYEWRTIRGVSKETGLKEDDVRNYIKSHGDEVVKSSARNAEGETLYTSRKSYRERSSLGMRLSSILRNRGA
ncbi:hypothetical protein [Pseudoalteromonas rhizosphaerae]|uniref:Uncharacterized protein n=1 Tax=Pseudoalteromonas rhizosphaerae TaxID=2518973 RepID=A0ABW8KST5_9GAMM